MTWLLRFLPGPGPPTPCPSFTVQRKQFATKCQGFGFILHRGFDVGVLGVETLPHALCPTSSWRYLTRPGVGNVQHGDMVGHGCEAKAAKINK